MAEGALTGWRPATAPPRGAVAVPPGPGQESVWDYPRPPVVRGTDERVVVLLGGVVLWDTTAALQVLETSHPPTYYLPVDEAAPGCLRPAAGETVCEFKGTARYLDLLGGTGPDGVRRVAARAAWTYPRPRPGFEALTGHVALYPAAVDEVRVDGERVRAQEGGFYGGWVTGRVVGPFKGAPGTAGW